MALTLVCLHGFTQNGAQLAAQLTELSARLPSSVELVCPDAPQSCSENTVQRMAAAFPDRELKPPHLCWWDASDDGSIYRGWELAVEQLRELCDRPGRVGVLGFSQGAIAAATLAGLRAAGQFPELAFVVLIAGRLPRAEALSPLFQAQVVLPSLHVWGERDAMAVRDAPQLMAAFEESDRQQVTWPGPHTIPTRGVGADAIVEFVSRFADR